jgi:hypothetical protein
VVVTQCTDYTVHKMGLILRSIERMLKMQFSMALKFTLQPLRRYDVKPPEKNRTSVIFEAACLQKTDQHRLGANLVPLDPQPVTLPMRHSYNYF